MDEDVVRFRRGAVRENRGRRGLSRRYSQELQRQAVAYWRIRKVEGDALPDVAQALGVAPWSLRRWADDRKSSPYPVGHGQRRSGRRDQSVAVVGMRSSGKVTAPGWAIAV
jgi:transposase-like protein